MEYHAISILSRLKSLLTIIAYLFCVGKLAVKHSWGSPCYPRSMDILLLFMVLGLLVVITMDAKQKRVAYLCQQNETENRY